MSGHLSVVSAKMKKGGKPKKHAHPVKRMVIQPTDNGGFSTETEMHPPEPKGERDMYMPGQTMTGAHKDFAALKKHVGEMLNLKTDEQEGNGMTDPGSAEDAEDKA